MTSSRETALLWLALLIVLACLAVAGTVEGSSLDPVTDCAWGEILTSDGTCR